METKVITRINNVDIVATSDEQYMPIRPICEALGVDPEGQRQRIERDEILSSTTFVIKAVAADGKEREMFCIPFAYIFGWLFSIDDSRVSEDVHDAVIQYKRECYDALYKHFTAKAKFMHAKQKLIDAQLDVISEAKKNFNNAKNILGAAEVKMKKIRDYSFEDYIDDDGQMRLFD